MIVVVEGPSAGGKSAWCQRHASAMTIPEGAPPGSAVPNRSDLGAWMHFWQSANEWRWNNAQAVEAERGIAVCDTDPFKLHYTWSLWQAGLAEATEWRAARELAREAFQRERLGLADVVLYEDVDESLLRQRRDSDRTRSRRHFETNVRLAKPLRLWYDAVAELEPARVVWGLPNRGLRAIPSQLGPREHRSGTALFDRLMSIVDRKSHPI